MPETALCHEAVSSGVSADDRFKHSFSMDFFHHNCVFFILTRMTNTYNVGQCWWLLS